MDHVLSMMDRKISDMTEKQFASSNIELLANTFVKGVGQKVHTNTHIVYVCILWSTLVGSFPEWHGLNRIPSLLRRHFSPSLPLSPSALQEVRIQRKGSKEVESIPCALVVWATGIKPRDFANKVGLPPSHCLNTERSACRRPASLLADYCQSVCMSHADPIPTLSHLCPLATHSPIYPLLHLPLPQVRKSIGLDAQNNFRGILTDGFMSVKGVEHGSMFAIGDCATIEQVPCLPSFITMTYAHHYDMCSSRGYTPYIARRMFKQYALRHNSTQRTAP
jgi:hypothetical protein